ATANVALGVILVAIGGAIVIASSAVAGAMRGVFGVALYHFGVDDEARGPFERSELAAAASGRQRRFGGPRRLSRATRTSIPVSLSRSVSPRRSRSASASSWIARCTLPPPSRR